MSGRLAGFVSVAVAIVVSLAAAGVSRAQSFSFTRIVDTGTAMPGAGGPFALFQPGPALDGDVVAFRGADGTNTDAYRGVYEAPAGGGGPVQVVMDGSTSFSGSTPTILDIETPSLDGGKIVFHARAYGPPPSYPQLADALFTDRTGVLTTLATDSAYAAFVGAPSFDAGQVLFHAAKYGGGWGVFLDTGGSRSELVSSGQVMPGTGGSFVFGQFADLSLSGANMAFAAVSYPSATVSGVYADLGAGLIRVADTTTAVPDGSGWSFTNLLLGLSLDGDVVHFIGGWGGTGLNGIYRFEGSTLVKVVDFNDTGPTGTVYRNFLAISSDGGHIAFSHAAFSNYGVFTDLGGTIEEVIATGDMLDGRTVSRVDIGRESLSANRIAFRAVFTDGSEGIYVATGPGAAAVPVVGPLGVGVATVLLVASGFFVLTRSVRGAAA